MRTFTILLAGVLTASSLNAEAAMRVWFQIKPAGSGVLITPFIDGARELLRYELESQSQSTAGLSSIRQGGFIPATQDGQHAITQLQLGGLDNGQCLVKLKIYQGEALLTEETLTDCRPAR